MAEESREIAERAFEAVEMAKKGGKIKKGTNEVTKAVERGNAKLVLVAQDVNPPEITMHIPLIAKEKGIPCIKVKSREELGAVAGINVPTVAIAVVNEGDAKKIIKELTEKLK